MLFNKKYIISLLFFVPLFFWSCFSTPSAQKKIEADITAIESALIAELVDTKIIIWEEGKSFNELDILNEYTFLEMHDTTINPSRSRDGIFSTIISLLDKNSIQKDIVITREFYIVEERVSYTSGMQVGPVIFYPDIIISLADVNNLPWVYYGRDRSNMTGHTAIDTRQPINTTFIVKNNELLGKYHGRVVEQTQSRINNNQQSNVNKLLALLINPMAAGTFGQFTEGETVITTTALLRIIDYQHSESEDVSIYLVAVNDRSVTKPFYIITNRKMNIMDLDYSNTIFQSLKLEYIGTGSYTSNGLPRETFVFRY
jgi:hypothetical protein